MSRGRVEIDFTVVRELTLDDLRKLEVERGVQKPVPLMRRLSERHMALARALASGVSAQEASAITGYTVNRISILRDDPTFKDLVQLYTEKVDSGYLDFHKQLSGATMDAVLMLRDRMEDEPENIATRELLEVVKTGADRTGYGPQSTNVTVQVDLAERLAAAYKRVEERKRLEQLENDTERLTSLSVKEEKV